MVIRGLVADAHNFGSFLVFKAIIVVVCVFRIQLICLFVHVEDSVSNECSPVVNFNHRLFEDSIKIM